MSYTINLTNGALFATIPDGTINSSSSMTLIGKNYSGYGAFLDSNFIHLLENSSNATPPTTPLVGQLWWDSVNGLMKVFNGIQFKNVATAVASASAPVNNVAGDLWFNTAANVLSVYSGSSYIAIGPSVTNGTGTQPTIIVDTPGAISHAVVEILLGGQIVGIFSKDATFTPASPITGFPVINPGYNIPATISGVNQYFQGTATNALALGNVLANSIMINNANTGTTGTLSVTNDTGLYVGANADFNVSHTGNDVILQNFDLNGNIIIKLNHGGVMSNAMVLYGSNTSMELPATGNISAQYFFGNGYYLSGISGGGGGYSNADVAAYLPTYTGNLTAGNISATGSVTGNYILGNGYFLTGISGGGGYSNANVASYLPTYGGNIALNFLTANGNVSTSGNVNVTGNISGNYIIGNGALLSGISGGGGNASPLPSGAVQYFAMNAPPTGWLIADGSNISRAAYNSLFSAIGVLYGSGDGSTTFTLPDLRGVFLRGIDNGRGYDSGRTFGSYQSDAYGIHSHTVTDAGHSHTVSISAHSHSATDSGHTHTPSDPGHVHTLSDTGHTHTVSGSHTHTVTDPGHIHNVTHGATLQVISNGTGGAVNVSAVTNAYNTASATTGITIASASTGDTIASAVTGASVASHTTGITIGSGSASITVGSASPSGSASASTTRIGIGSTGGVETRGKNVALLPCIKF